jgi:iron complex outermembrane receptor protein
MKRDSEFDNMELVHDVPFSAHLQNWNASRKALRPSVPTGFVTCTALGAIMSFGLMQTAMAQANTDAAQQQNAGGAYLEEVVVTAQRRAENLQDVPIAVNSFSATDIQRARIQSFDDLGLKIPGFSINSFSKSRLNPAMRGGSTSLPSAGAEQAVGLFIDDQYFGGVGDFEVDLFDVERIEVLRGPQGTLFGRNTTGGSINVVTKKPSDTFEGEVEVSLGNYDALDIKGMVTGPLSDTLSVLLAVSSRDRDGTSFNTVTGNDIDNVNRTSFRGKLLWEPSDTLDVTLSVGFSRADETGTARDAIFLDVPIDNQDLIDVGFVPDDDPRVVQQFSDGRYMSDQWTANLRVSKDLDTAEILSITTYRNFKSKEDENSLAGVPIPVFSIGEPRTVEAFSQEFRYVSDYSGPLNFVGGAFAFYSDETRELNSTTLWEENTFGGAFQSITYCPEQTVDDFNNGIVTPSCIVDYPDLFTPNEFTVAERNRTTSLSVYMEGTFDLTDTLTARAGGRYTYDKKKFDAVSSGAPDFFWNPAPLDVQSSDSWNEFTYRVGLDWKPADDMMVYVSRATGFRSGVFDAAQSDQSLRGAAVAPETVVSHEVGFKSRLLNQRLQLNATLFHARYKDLQFFINTGPSSLTTNAGRATVKGAEIELVAAVTDELTLSAIYSHQKGSSSGIPAEAEITEGTPPAGTVPNTYIVALDYEKDFANGQFFAHLDFMHKDRYGLEFNDVPQFESKVKSMINASAGYSFSNGWGVSLWGKNLTNENVVIYGQDFWFTFYSGPTAFANLDVITESQQPRYAAPRTFGVTLSKSF